MAISPDGRLLATGSGYSDTMIRLWEVPSMRSVGGLRGHAAWIAALKFARDGRTLVSGSADQTIRLWDLATKETTRIYRGMAAEPSRLCLGPSDDKVFSGGSDGTVFRWPALSRPEQPPPGLARIETGLPTLVVSPGCAQFAGVRNGSVYLGDLQPYSVPIRLPALGTNNEFLLFSPQPHFLFFGTLSGVVQVWSLADQRIRASVQGAAEPVCWLGQDAKGSVLVVVHLGDPFQNPAVPHAVSVWNTADWQPRKAFSIPGASPRYAVSPDGNFLVAGDYAVGNVQIWNLNNPGQTRTLTFPGSVVGIAFSPDSKRLAAATLDGTVGIWEVPGFRQREIFRAAGGALLALDFSSDARRLVTAGARAASLQIWDVATWQQLISIESPEEIARGAFTPDGNQLVGVGNGGNVFLWRVPAFQNIDAYQRTERPTTTK